MIYLAQVAASGFVSPLSSSAAARHGRSFMMAADATSAIQANIDALTRDMEIMQLKAQLAEAQKAVEPAKAAVETAKAAVEEASSAAEPAAAVEAAHATVLADHASVIEELLSKAAEASSAVQASLLQEQGSLGAAAADSAFSFQLPSFELPNFGLPSIELPPLPTDLAAGVALPSLPTDVALPTSLALPAELAIPLARWAEILGDLATALADFNIALSGALHSPVFAALTPQGAALQLSAIALFGAGAAIGTAKADGTAPYEAGTTTYSPTVADDFYAQRPLLVAQRMAKLSYLTSAFTTGLLFDWLVLGKLLKDEEYTVRAACCCLCVADC